MGNHHHNSKVTEKEKEKIQSKAEAKAENEINIKKFNKLNVVGKGGFGKVIIL